MDEISTVSRSSGQIQKHVSGHTLCVGQMNESKEAITRWEGQVEEFKMYLSHKELSGIDGEAIEFEWNIFPAFSSLQMSSSVPTT